MKKDTQENNHEKLNKITEKSAGKLLKFLDVIERAGNALPHPAILFLLLTGITILLSWIAFNSGMSAIHPIKKEAINTVNLFSIDGLHHIITDMVKNFAGFAPLGSVLVAMLGFSLAEKSGLISTILRVLVLKAPKKLIVPAVLLGGVLSHTAGDVGYIILIPLSGMVFHSVGWNPLAGIACAFAGVSGGFAANLLLSTADPMLSGITQEAAKIIDPSYTVSPLSNWYFMASSSFLIVIIGTLVTNKITIPYLGEYTGDAEKTPLVKLTKLEKKGLLYAGIVFAILTSILLLGLVPAEGFLREKETFSVLNSPVLKGVVAIIFFMGSLTGLAYGFASKTFRSQSDVVNAMQEAMATLAPYLVLVFFASQFISFFNFSNMGMVMAVHGSDYLKDLGLGSFTLMISFIFFTCLLDLVIGSASAKWALMAPIFVPMFMLLGFAPELTQASYRVADSVVNIISPLMSYFPLILAFVNKFNKNAKVGTLLAMMLPYTIAFTIFWSAMIFVWMTFELPLGPVGNLWYKLPTP
ncbi:MAG: AbgT family transporter [Bdellovibrionota bacterium]